MIKNIIFYILNFINKYTSLVLLAGIIVLLMLLSFKCQRNNSLSEQIFKNNQNISALNDTLKIEKTKSGAMEASISGFLASEKELKSLNADLYNQIKSQKNDILSLSNAVVKLVQDTTQLRKYLNKVISQNDSTIHVGKDKYIVPFTLAYTYDKDNFDLFRGQSLINSKYQHLNSELLSRVTQIKLSWGQRIEDNKLRIFVESKYPGFTVESLSGVLIDPNESPYIRKLMKKKHWFTGWNIGIGVTPGFNLGTGGYSLVIGPTFSWNIYNF